MKPSVGHVVAYARYRISTPTGELRIVNSVISYPKPTGMTARAIKGRGTSQDRIQPRKL